MARNGIRDREAWRRRRTAILFMQGMRCLYCLALIDSDAATMEHVTPRALGGTNNPENLVVACRACNHRRGSGSLVRMLAWLDRRRAQLARLRAALEAA